jgi:hypothetical protein
VIAERRAKGYTTNVFFLLGLLAKAGHGKTSVAQHLARRYGTRTRSLAGPMKRAVQNVFGFSDEQLWGPQAAKDAPDPRYGFSPRWLLQRLGNEGLRVEFGDDVHHRALALSLTRETAASSSKVPPVFVLDDVRFPNDAAFVAQGGEAFRGAVLKIITHDTPASVHGDHASERGIDEVEPAHVTAVVEGSRREGLDVMLARVDRVLAESAGFAAMRAALGAERAWDPETRSGESEQNT